MTISEREIETAKTVVPVPVRTSVVMMALGACAIAFVTFFYSSIIVLLGFTALFDKNRRAIFAAANGWGKSFAWLAPGLTYEVRGRENLLPRSEAAVYVANHQSMLDVALLLLLDRPIRFMAKASLYSIPIFGWALRLIGFVPIKRESGHSRLESFREMTTIIHNGFPVILFAEGMRSRNGNLQKLRPGAFRLAVETGVRLVPVTIAGAWDYLPRGAFIPRKARVVVTIHPPIDPAGRTAEDIRSEVQDMMAKTLSES